MEKKKIKENYDGDTSEGFGGIEQSDETMDAAYFWIGDDGEIEELSREEFLQRQGITLH